MERTRETLTGRLAELQTAQLVEVARRCNDAHGADRRQDVTIRDHALCILCGRLEQDDYYALCAELEAA